MSAPVPILPGNRAVRYVCTVCKRRHDGTYGSGKYCSAACVPNFPCEVCAKLHDCSYGSGRFCSSRCSRNVGGSSRRVASRKNNKRTTGKKKKGANEGQHKSKQKMSVYSLLN